MVKRFWSSFDKPILARTYFLWCFWKTSDSIFKKFVHSSFNFFDAFRPCTFPNHLQWQHMLLLTFDLVDFGQLCLIFCDILENFPNFWKVEFESHSFFFLLLVSVDHSLDLKWVPLPTQAPALARDLHPRRTAPTWSQRFPKRLILPCKLRVKQMRVLVEPAALDWLSGLVFDCSCDGFTCFLNSISQNHLFASAVLESGFDMCSGNRRRVSRCAVLDSVWSFGYLPSANVVSNA